MNAFTFTPASRESAKARIGLQGPAGCGKTKTALRLAEGLANGGTIGVVDTERGSALKYAPVPGRPDLGGHEFGHMPMDAHDPRHLIQAVKVAEEAGIAVLIVDSWSHFWNGRGGLLEIVEQTGAKASGGKFGAWRDANPIEQDMLDAMLNFRGHLIVTMRTKGDYVIEGKKVTKVGVKAVQRDGAEYELDVVMDMVEGTATVTKTRYEPLEGMSFHHPGPDVAETILDQLGQGVDPVQVLVDGAMADDLTYEGALGLYKRADRRNLLGAETLHPVTGKPTTLEALIVERGKAVRPAAPQEQQAPRQAAGDNRVYRQTDAARAADQQGAESAPTSDAEIAADTAKARQEMYQAAEVAGLTCSEASARFKAKYGSDSIYGTAEQLRAAAASFASTELQEPTDAELRAALDSGHPEVEASAAELLIQRGQMPVSQQQAQAADTHRAAKQSSAAVTAPQMRMMHAAFNDLGISDRAARLDATSLIIARRIGTANELTKDEAAQLLETLAGFAGLENALEKFGDYVDELARKAEESAVDGAGGAAAPPSGASSDEYAAAADAA